VSAKSYLIFGTLVAAFSFREMDTVFVHKLLDTHPNEFAIHPSLNLPQNWLDLILCYSGCPQNAALPTAIEALIYTIRHEQLARSPIPMKISPLPSEQGMSPKKAHEVSRMSEYVVQLATNLPEPASRLHIVDIGAGQGYLTRTLKARLPSTHILALDADTAQTFGAQRWEQRLLSNAHPPIDHKVIFISPQSLLSTIDEWVLDPNNGSENTDILPVPVIFVGLHACGSLTPNILRAFTTARATKRKWYPAGLVVVGCCYNLMDPVGVHISYLFFPLSLNLELDYPPRLKDFPTSAYQLAAQVPSQWLQMNSAGPSLDPSAALSIRKVVYRALLEKAVLCSRPKDAPLPRNEAAHMTLPSKKTNPSATVPARWSRDNTDAGLNSNSESQKKQDTNSESVHRLGRLRDSAYTSWNSFLHIAEQRMKVVFPLDQFDLEENHALSDSLSSLHVLRCLLGPLIESCILRYRLDCVRQLLSVAKVNAEPDEGSSPTHEFRTELVNLFDQSTGSGRNVAIVIAPPSFDFFSNS